MHQAEDTAVSVLLVMSGPNMTRRIPLEPQTKPVYVIGRGTADIVLLDPLVSGRHAEVAWSEDQWVLRDLNSAVGTFLNSKRISAPASINHNDKIRCGSTTLIYLNYPQPVLEPDAAAVLAANAAQNDADARPVHAMENNYGKIEIEAEFFGQLNSSLISAADSKDVLTRTAKVLLTRPQIDCVYVILKDAAGNLMPYIELQKTSDQQCVLYSSIIDQAFSEAKPVYVEDIARFKGLPSVVGIQSVFVLPIKGKTNTTGVMYLGSRKSSAFNEPEINMLYNVGAFAAMHIENIELSRTARQYQRLSDAGQTAANLSHTIKNIIQAIGGATEVIDFAFEKNQIARARSSWEILKKNVERIKKFSLDMLTLTRETKAIFTNCNFNKMVASAVESLKAKSAEKGVTIELETDGSIPPGQCDVDKMNDVILNLVMNAIDAVEENKGIITVTTCFDQQRKIVLLSVKDNGPGIKMEDQDKIFQPFHTTKAKTGTGLGLAIVKRVIELHNGTITLESAPGQGANFVITLPLCPA